MVCNEILCCVLWLFVWVTTKKERKIQRRNRAALQAIELELLWAQQEWATGFNFTLFVHSFITFHLDRILLYLMSLLDWRFMHTRHDQSHGWNSYLEKQKKSYIFQACSVNHSFWQGFVIFQNGRCFVFNSTFTVLLWQEGKGERMAVRCKGPEGQKTWLVSDLILFPSGRHTSCIWQSVRNRCQWLPGRVQRSDRKGQKKHKSARGAVYQGIKTEKCCKASSSQHIFFVQKN